jgi:hypothetical protein
VERVSTELMIRSKLLLSSQFLTENRCAPFLELLYQGEIL